MRLLIWAFIFIFCANNLKIKTNSTSASMIKYEIWKKKTFTFARMYFVCMIWLILNLFHYKISQYKIFRIVDMRSFFKSLKCESIERVAKRLGQKAINDWIDGRVEVAQPRDRVDERLWKRVPWQDRLHYVPFNIGLSRLRYQDKKKYFCCTLTW